MTRRRALPLALAATALLLAVVALAAGGRPLSSGGGGGSGPTVTFWDYAFTTLLAVEVLAFIGAVVMFWNLRPDIGTRKSNPAGTLRALLILISVVGLFFFVELRFFNHHNQVRDTLPGRHGEPVDSGSQGGRTSPPAKHRTQEIDIQWTEIVVLFALAAAGVAVYVVRRKQLGNSPRRPGRVLETAPETVAVALDQSLDDLRSDPDLRRAIIAAYARMEKTLASVGLPRIPAEAPREYLERVLLSLAASAGAISRLTDLFEWARFSHHEPEPAMRDEAIDALVALRDELRAREPVATW